MTGNKMSQTPRWLGTVELDLGFIGPEPLVRIAGITMTPSGSAWVVDGGAATAYLVGPDGQLIAVVGQRGSGPGDLRDPCCPTMDAHGRLWVVNSSSLSAFRVDGTEVRFESAVAVRAPGTTLARRPPVVSREGDRVMAEIVRRDPGGDFRQYERSLVELDMKGELMREWPHPFRFQDAIGLATYEFPRRPIGRFIRRPIPFAGRLIFARSPSGLSYATVQSNRYEIMVHHQEGALIARVERGGILGPELTSAEREFAEETLTNWASQAERGGGIAPDVKVPLRKPAIANVWFDLDSRLWVALSRPGRSSLAEADVYSEDGKAMFRAVWPAGVDLSDGACSGDIAWGKRLGEMDEDRIVWLKFRVGV